MTQKENYLLLQIPNKLDDTISLYVDGVFVDKLDVNQVNQYRINIVKHILKTGDSSILNRFYFIGHKVINDMPGKEIKIEMDETGNLSDLPYEMSYVRIHMWTLLKMDMEHSNKIKQEKLNKS